MVNENINAIRHGISRNGPKIILVLCGDWLIHYETDAMRSSSKCLIMFFRGLRQVGFIISHEASVARN